MNEKNKNSAARIAANNRYNAKKYDKITIMVPAGLKDIIKAQAAANHESTNAYLNRLIADDVQ